MSHLFRNCLVLRWRAVLYFAILLVALPATPQQAADIAQPETSKPDAGPRFEVPDGTEIRMRFAQPVIGPAAVPLLKVLTGSPTLPPLAQEGDRIRLVAAAEVRVGNKVVVSKGAPAQATVETVEFAHLNSKKIETGLTLRLDWMTTVTGERLPLRASRKGKARPFEVEVFSSHGGLIVREPNFRRDMFEALSLKVAINNFHMKMWVPAGTRILGFVHGGASVDATKLEKAQSALPIPNPKALVTIYRTGGDAAQRLAVTCNGAAVGEIGERENISAELAPGRSSCRAGDDTTLEFEVKADEEYFIHLRQHKLSGKWELKLVDATEGEDVVAASALRKK